MKGKKHRPEKIIRIVRKAEAFRGAKAETTQIELIPSKKLVEIESAN